MTVQHARPGLLVVATLLLAACSGGDATVITAAGTPTPVATSDAGAAATTPATGTVKVVPKTSPTVKPAPKQSTSAPKPRPRPAPKPARGVNLQPLRSGPGTTFTATVKHRPGEEFGTGTVRLWLPDKVAAVRGLLVGGFFPGDPAKDPRPGGEVEKLALKYHLAVVTHTFTHLEGTRERREAYCHMGSARGLARGLTAIAGQAKHREIASAPFVIHEGYSLAGLCAKGIAETFPSRTAVLAYGGMSRVDCTVRGMAAVPTLIYGGANDGFVKNIPNEIAQCRAQGMPIAVALQPGAGHSIRGSKPTRYSYLDGVLAQRLPLTAGGPLRRIDLATGYLADNATHTAAPFNAYSGAKNKASWLPTAASVAAWKAWTTP